MTMLRPAEGAVRAAAHDDVDIARDRDLVLRAQQGDRGAFDDLYVRYYYRLWRFCYKRLQDDHEAEDVTQEAFVRAWRALPGFAGERRFYPWISVIAAHLCSNVTRRRSRMNPVGEFPERDLTSWEDCGEDRVMANHDIELATRAFARLSKRHQAILELRESRGWSYQRIAEHEGVRTSTVESLLWRAREALRRQYALENGGGRIAGIAGGLLYTLRRWIRIPKALVHGTTVVPSAASAVMGSATAVTSLIAASITTLAVIAGSIGVAIGSASGVVSSGPALTSVVLAHATMVSTETQSGVVSSAVTPSATTDTTKTPAEAAPSAAQYVAPGTAAPLSPGGDAAMPGAPLTPSVPASEASLPSVSPPSASAPSVTALPAVPSQPDPTLPATSVTALTGTAQADPSAPTTLLETVPAPASGTDPTVTEPPAVPTSPVDAQGSEPAVVLSSIG